MTGHAHRPSKTIDGRIVAGACLLAALGAACTQLKSLVPAPKPAMLFPWEEEVPERLSDESVRQRGSLHIAELLRILEGSVDDSLTLAAQFTDGRPAADSAFEVPVPILRELGGAYAGVPRHILRAIVWQDSAPTSSSPDLGTFLNLPRIGQLSWWLDSTTVVINSRLRLVHRRRPGDWVPLAIASHELTHLALDYSGLSMKLSISTRECVADIVGAFQVVAVAQRVTKSGAWNLALVSFFQRLAAAMGAGDWLSSERHPDSEQRAACLHRGEALYSDQLARQAFVGALIRRSRRDSLIDDLLEGRVSLLEAAVSEAASILSSPTEAKTVAEVDLSWLGGDPAAAAALELLDTLLSKLDDSASFEEIAGERVSTGVSLFPSNEVYGLRVSVDAPWKCAVLPESQGDGRSVGCYAVGGLMESMLLSSSMGDKIEIIAMRHGYSAEAFGPTLARGSHLNLLQWLLERDGERIVVSVYHEPFPSQDPFGRSQSTSRTVWFAFTLLPLPAAR